MEEEHRRKIEKIIGQLQCPKDFKCTDFGFENLCKARDFGIDDFLECLEDNPSRCSFAFHFGNTYFCQCPLRVYLAKKLKK